MELAANDIHLSEDEYEASATFVWPDALQGWDSLTLSRDWASTDERPPPIWVGRRMPLYSGRAGIQRAQLGGNRFELLFTQELAERLQLPIQVRFVLSVGAERVQRLREILDRIFEECAFYQM